MQTKETVYELTADVTNPKPDRRSKKMRDQVVWSKGTRFRVVDRHLLKDTWHKVIEFCGERYASLYPVYENDDYDRFNLLLKASSETTESFYEFADRIRLKNCAIELLAELAANAEDALSGLKYESPPRVTREFIEQFVNDWNNRE